MNRMIKQKKSISWLAVTLWGLAAALLGYFFWRSSRYGYRLYRQPYLLPLVVPDDIAAHQTIEAQGLALAAINLQTGIEKRFLPDGREKWVVCAGLRNFREPWARDFGFASFGLVELGQLEVVKECLEVFLINQRPTGQFPVKVHATNFVDRYLHSFFKREQPLYLPIKPKYITAHNTISLDGNALLVIAALNYARRATDTEFLAAYWPALKQAVIWLEDHALEADGLLHQGKFSDWADSIARSGRVLYTNVIYWKALADLADTAQWLDDDPAKAYFAAKARQLKMSINSHFWRDDLGFYVTNQFFDILSSAGNLLAIAWGLTTLEQSHSILDKMNEFKMANPVPTQVTHRSYPKKFIAIENRLGGIPHYHTSVAWLWIGAWHVIALSRMKRLAEAETLLFRISNVIVRDGGVYEVYAPTGYPLATFWYTSEAPFTWSAGMVVYAHYVYQRHRQLT